MQRQAKKMVPHHFFNSVLASVADSEPTLRSMAIGAGLQRGDTIAKQSFWERISKPEAVAFFKACVMEAFKTNLKSVCPVEPLNGIGRILIGDSSAIELHRSLNEIFPGGSNQNKQSAQLRLQCTLDLLSGQWVDGGFERYLRQDAKAAHDLVEKNVLKKADLIIRDLGYAVIDSFAGIAAKDAFFLSRLHPQWNVYSDAAKGDKLDLITLLEQKAIVEGSCFRMKVRIGSRQKMPCELIAVRIPAAVAATRRRRAREVARRKGVTHTKRYMRLQNWTLLVTNLDESSATIDQLCELYRLRWRVEMFFKLCKSHTPLKKIACHRTNPYHAEVMLWAWLFLMVGLSSQSVFAMAEVRIFPPPQFEAQRPFTVHPRLHVLNRSAFKIMPQLLRLISYAIKTQWLPDGATLVERILVQCDYHNQYEKRNDRISLPQRLRSMLQISA